MRWFLLIFFFMPVLVSHAQVIQNFELTNATDGKTISLNYYSSNPGVVVIFFTNECPYSEYYSNRIKGIGDSYSGKTPVILINPSTEPTESTQEMASFATRNNFKVPYLADKEQKAMTLFNPRKSPECFLLKNSGGKFSIVYRGAIDDNAQSAESVNHPYLQNAIEQLLAGKKIELSEMRPIGCSLQKK